MAAFPQPNILSHNTQSFSQLPPGPYLRNAHPSFPVHFPPSYFPIPAGWDPSVSLAHPYIYDPTQVKHRRRTTPEQLKILEDTFKTDPKPNAVLRKKLSLEIGMTPRVLQVWFQNRRMKVKRMAKKCTAPRASAEPESAPTSEPTDPSTSPAAPTPTSENHDSPTSPPASTPSRAGSPVTDAGARLLPPPQSENSRRASLPTALSTATFNLAPDAPSPHNLRSPFRSFPDPALYRRRSMTSLKRLESHPFAPLVAATNGLNPTHTIIPPTPPAFSATRGSFPHHQHSPSTPAQAPPTRLQPTNRAASFHVVPSPQHLHAFHPHTIAQPYAFPPRPLEPPIPGPLPAADYSFGTPPVQHPAQEEVDVRPYLGSAFNAQAAAVTIPRLTADDDTDTEYSSRFGSIASDTSSGSVWGGDRRESLTTGHVVDMLSGLAVGGVKVHQDLWAPGSSTESLVYPEDALEPEAYDIESYEDGTKFGEQVFVGTIAGARDVPISQSSELAYALCSGGGENMLDMR